MEDTKLVGNLDQTYDEIIILLHDCKESGVEMYDLAHELHKDSTLSKCLITIPNAPYKCDDKGYQWLSPEDNLSEPERLNITSKELDDYVNSLADYYNIPISNITLVGHAQGALAALHYGLTCHHQLKEVVAIDLKWTNDELNSTIFSHPLVALIHGKLNLTIPVTEIVVTEAWLSQHEVPYQVYIAEDSSHSLDEAKIEAVKHAIESVHQSESWIIRLKDNIKEKLHIG